MAPLRHGGATARTSPARRARPTSSRRPTSARRSASSSPRRTRGGSTPRRLEPDPVVNGAPTNTALPTISGTAPQGQTLTPRTAPGAATRPAISYQWRRCDNPARTAPTSPAPPPQTYVLQPADVGKTIRVVVTATSPAGSGSATSAATAVVQAVPTQRPAEPADDLRPPYLGQTLTAATGTWNPTRRASPTSGAAATPRRNCSDIAGADRPDLRPHRRRRRLDDPRRRHRHEHQRLRHRHLRPDAVISGAPSVDLANPPTISGQPFVTQTLDADPGTWNGNPTGYTYLWQRCPAQAAATARSPSAARPSRLRRAAGGRRLHPAGPRHGDEPGRLRSGDHGADSRRPEPARAAPFRRGTRSTTRRSVRSRGASRASAPCRPTRLQGDRRRGDLRRLGPRPGQRDRDDEQLGLPERWQLEHATTARRPPRARRSRSRSR